MKVILRNAACQDPYERLGYFSGREQAAVSPQSPFKNVYLPY